MDRWTVAAVDRLAARQRSLLTSAQAVALLGRSRTHRWRAGGRLVEVQPRVLRMHGAATDWHQQLLAAELSADGVVSHRSAADLWGLRPAEGAVEVSVRPPRCPRIRPPAVLHRVHDLCPERAVIRQGLRVTDPMRTVIDLGLVVSAAEVSDALSAGLASKLFPLSAVAALRDALGRPGRNGTGVVRELLEQRALHDAREESVLEGRLLAIVASGAVPPPAFQHEVWDDGRFVARVDAAWPGALVAVEVDGYRTHGVPEAFQADRTRDVRLAALGWVVLRFTWDDLARRPTEVAASIRAVLAARAGAAPSTPG